jgi:redox-sensitive bicupin YhaK (pirin superfamily)
MIEITPLEDLGHADHGWLDAHHHFSFADYVNPDRIRFGPLRVWNDDTIQPKTGFPMHPHRDMEIITYIRKGAITHEDNLGNKGRTVAGDVQVMSAGTGIYHAEYNVEDEATELFQIWVEPNAQGLPPRWETKSFPTAGRDAELKALASGRPGHDDALEIFQDAAFLGATLNAGQAVEHALEPGRRAYLVPVRGRVRVNGHVVPPRAGVAVTGEENLAIEAEEDTEVVLLDLP